MSFERAKVANPYWMVPAEFRGAAGRAVRDQRCDDSLSLESESSCESLSPSESNSSSVSRTSSVEADDPVDEHQVAEDEDRRRIVPCPHFIGMDDEPHSHSNGAKPSAIHSTFPFYSTRGGDEPLHLQLNQHQQQELLPELQLHPSLQEASHIRPSGCASSDAWPGLMQSQVVISGACAKCKPLYVSRAPPGGTGQAMCSDGDGVLILLALDHRGLCLLRISAPQACDHLTGAGAIETSGGSSFCESRELLNIGGDLPFIRRLQGEAAVVQLGSESLLLISKPPDPVRGQPARLAVHPLSRAVRKYAARMGKCEESLNSLGFDELPTWPSGPDEAAPEPRSFYGVAVDHARQTLLLFGGASSVQENNELERRTQAATEENSCSPKWHPLDDLWSFSISSCAWVQQHRPSRQHSANSAGVKEYSEEVSLPSWPKAVAGHSMTACHREIWMFGGYTRPACADTGSQEEAAPINDLWCLDLESGLWRPVPSSGPAPPPRYLHVACMVGKSLFLFGGLGAHGPVAAEDTLYAADLSARATAAWTRVSLDSASLPPPDYYLGAAPTLDDEEFSGATDLIIYGGRSAYVISAQLQAGAAHPPSLEPFTYDEEAPSTADEPLVPYDETSENFECMQDAENIVGCQKQLSFSETEGRYTNEGGSHTGSEARDENREVCGQSVNRGMQILATLMPGAERQGPETGRTKTAAAWGLLSPLRSVPEAPCASRAGRWHPAFPINPLAAPIIFRARRRGRRHTDSASLEGSEKAQGHVSDLSSNLPNDMSGTQPLFQSQAAPQTSDAPYAQQETDDLPGSEVYTCERASQLGVPSLLRPTAATVQPSAPPAPDPLHEAQHPLSQRQVSILLSLSHQATLGSAGITASGVLDPRSFPAQADSWYSQPLSEPRSNPTQTALPASVNPCSSSLYSSPVAGCRRPTDVSSPRTRRAQSTSSTAGEQGGVSPHAKDRRISMNSQASRKTSSENASEPALKPKLRRLGSVASRQPPARLKTSPPLNHGGPQSPQGGVEALMRWMDSALETHPDSSAPMGGLHCSFAPGTPNQGTSSGGRGQIMSAWAAGSGVSPPGISGDAAYTERQRSTTLKPLPVVPWLDFTQDQPRFLASRVYSSQLPSELPQRKASLERKGLPPLPTKLGVLAQSASSSRSKSMIARHVSHHAFTAEANGEEVDGGLPLPRPARRLKPSAPKTRKSGCTVRAKENAGVEPPKVKHADAKPTPPLVQGRQAHRLVAPKASVPWSGRPRSTGQGHSAAAYEMPLSGSGTRKATRKDKGELVSGSTLRRSSTRKASLPSSVIEEHRPVHARLLRRMTGWPAEAIAAFFLARSTPPPQRASKSRGSSAATKSKNGRKT
ncbi:hypothetical protein ACSSS7_004130 [Eimeria intestinalis]